MHPGKPSECLLPLVLFSTARYDLLNFTIRKHSCESVWTTRTTQDRVLQRPHLDSHIFRRDEWLDAMYVHCHYGRTVQKETSHAIGNPFLLTNFWSTRMRRFFFCYFSVIVLIMKMGLIFHQKFQVTKPVWLLSPKNVQS